MMPVKKAAKKKAPAKKKAAKKPAKKKAAPKAKPAKKKTARKPNPGLHETHAAGYVSCGRGRRQADTAD